MKRCIADISRIRPEEWDKHAVPGILAMFNSALVPSRYIYSITTVKLEWALAHEICLTQERLKENNGRDFNYEIYLQAKLNKMKKAFDYMREHDES